MEEEILGMRVYKRNGRVGRKGWVGEKSTKIKYI